MTTGKYRIYSTGGKFPGTTATSDDLDKAFEDLAVMLEQHVPHYIITPFPKGYAWELKNPDPNKSADTFVMQILAKGEVPQLSLERALRLAEQEAMDEDYPTPNPDIEAALEDTRPIYVDQIQAALK